jgi:hypothetical protein
VEEERETFVRVEEEKENFARVEEEKEEDHTEEHRAAFYKRYANFGVGENRVGEEDEKKIREETKEDEGSKSSSKV